MHSEVWQSSETKNIGSWYWHLRARNGQIVTDAEAFPTKGNAVRAAKAVVSAVIKQFHAAKLDHITFTPVLWVEKRRCWVIKWS